MRYHGAPPKGNSGIKLYISVQTTLLPLLLPPEPHKRSLYLPYDPPSDICVSAPTGSGKTLAYVLPIVEVRAFSWPVNLASDGGGADTLFSRGDPFTSLGGASDS